MPNGCLNAALAVAPRRPSEVEEQQDLFVSEVLQERHVEHAALVLPLEEANAPVRAENSQISSAGINSN